MKSLTCSIPDDDEDQIAVDNTTLCRSITRGPNKHFLPPSEAVNIVWDGTKENTRIRHIILDAYISDPPCAPALCGFEGAKNESDFPCEFVADMIKRLYMQRRMIGSSLDHENYEESE